MKEKLILGKSCVVCGGPGVCRTGYAYFEDGSEIIGVPWCEEHERQFLVRFANPVFESPKALERFKKEHPRLYSKIRGKEIVFLRKSGTATPEVVAKIRQWRNAANAERLKERDYGTRQRLVGQVMALNRVLDLLEGAG
jgi:hypothetical protein